MHGLRQPHARAVCSPFMCSILFEFVVLQDLAVRPSEVITPFGKFAPEFLEPSPRLKSKAKARVVTQEGYSRTDPELELLSGREDGPMPQPQRKRTLPSKICARSRQCTHRLTRVFLSAYARLMECLANCRAARSRGTTNRTWLLPVTCYSAMLYVCQVRATAQLSKRQLVISCPSSISSAHLLFMECSSVRCGAISFAI